MKTGLMATICLFGAAFTSALAYVAGQSEIEISCHKFSLSQLDRPLRIVAISDLHLPSRTFSVPDVVNLVRAQSPDLFVLAGDIVDTGGHEYLVRLFATIDAPLAKVAVLGNWEYYGKIDFSELARCYKEAGITLLVNSAIRLANLRMIGFDDDVHGSPDYEVLGRLQYDGAAALFIMHCPQGFDTVSTFSPVQGLVLSGHTHGGQIAPFGFPLITPRGSGRYVAGWYHSGKHSMYVMRGFGTTPWIPLRVGSKPEILVLDLVPGQM